MFLLIRFEIQESWVIITTNTRNSARNFSGDFANFPNISMISRSVRHPGYTQRVKKLCHHIGPTFVHNFDKYWLIFRILSLSYSLSNLQQNPCHISPQTLKLSLHYLAKYKRPKLATFKILLNLTQWHLLSVHKIYQSYDRMYRGSVAQFFWLTEYSKQCTGISRWKNSNFLGTLDHQTVKKIACHDACECWLRLCGLWCRQSAVFKITSNDHSQQSLSVLTDTFWQLIK